MPAGGNFSACACGPDTQACESPTQPVATVGVCLADGTPIAVTVVRDCSGTVTSEGWINLTSGTWSAGQPPAGTIACGDSRSIQVSGTFCDVDPDSGDVLGLVLVEYSYADDGSIASVRLVDAVTGETYVPQGEVTTCPAGIAQPERDMIQLCDVNDDESGAPAVSVPFLRDYARDENGAITGHSDYTLDGDAYVPVGTVGTCQAEPKCTDSFTQMLCDETVEVTWTQTSVVPDPAQPAGRGFIFTLSPADDPSIVGTINVLVDRANGSCGANYWPNGATFSYTLDAVAQSMESLRVNLEDFDTAESITMLSGGAPDRLGGNAYAAAGGVIRSNLNNAYGYMFFDSPPAALSYRFGGSCIGLNFNAVSTRNVQFLRKITTDCETGQVVSVTDTTLDGQPYTVEGEIGECSVEAKPCASTVSTLRLCDLDPNVTPDADGKRCAVPFLRHLVHDCTGALVETRDTAMDGTTLYAPVEVVDCGSGGVPAMVEVPWEVVDIQPDPGSAAGRGLIFTLSPIDDPDTVGTVRVTTSSSYNPGPCPSTPPNYGYANPTTYTFTPDQALQDAATYVRCDLLDFDTFEPVTGLTPPPSRLGGTAYWDGTTVRPTASNGVGEMYYDGPPATWTYRVGNTGGGNSCSALSFAAVSLRAEGCCSCDGGGSGEGGRTVQEVCVIANAAPTVVMTWTRVIEDDGATIYYLDQTGARFDTTLPAGHQIVPCPEAEPEPCRDSSVLLLCDLDEDCQSGGTPGIEDIADPSAFNNYYPGSVPGWCHLSAPGQGAPVWSGGSVVLGPDPACTHGAGGETHRVIGALLKAGDASLTEPVEVTVQFQVTNNGPNAGYQLDGRLALWDVVAGKRLTSVDPQPSTALGVTQTVKLTGLVPAASLAAGQVAVILDLETYHRNGEKGWTVDQFEWSAAVPVSECAAQFMRTIVTDCETGETVSVVDTTLDGQPYEVTGEVGQCQALGGGEQPCRNSSALLLCDLPAGDPSGAATATDALASPYPWDADPLRCVNDHPGGGGALWTGGDITIPARTNATGACSAQQVLVGVAAALQGAPPSCTDDTAEVTVTVNARNGGPSAAAANYAGALRLHRSDTGERIALSAVELNGQPAGQTRTLTATATVPADLLEAGQVIAVIDVEAWDFTGNTGAAWTLSGFTATFTYGQEGCGTQFLRTVVTDCETGTVVSTIDTTLDGAPYVVEGEVGQCETTGSGSSECAACETLTLCDVQADESSGAPDVDFEAIDLSVLPDGPASGTLSNGVGWTVSCGEWLAPQGHYTIYPVGGGGTPACDQVWSFDQPVYARFGLRGLNVGPGECLGWASDTGAEFVVESLASTHEISSTPNTICGLGTAADQSVIVSATPVSEVTLSAISNPGQGRGTGLVEVGLLNEPPAAGSVTTFLRTVCRDCSGAVISTTDTTLDGDPYTPTGTVSSCASAGSSTPVEPAPCRDTSSTLLCDTAAQEAVTVFDPANVPGADGWQVVSFTGANPGAGPEGPMPYDALTGTVFMGPVLGARTDLSAGTPAVGGWPGYDAAAVRWVLRKTFTAPEDGMAVVQAYGFRGDGGARVRVNSVDAGLYGQWNQPAVDGTTQVPITAGPNTIEIEVRDVGGVNGVAGRLDITMNRTIQFMRRQTVDCDTGEVIATHDTTLGGEPYTVTGEVGQCEPVAECCEQAPPEQRVDVETSLLCIRDEDSGDVLGQVLVERVYDDQSGDRTVQRLTDPTTGDEVELPDGAALVLCQESGRDVELLPMCVLDNGTGGSIQRILAEVVYDTATGDRLGVSYVDPATWGPVALPGGTRIGLCPDAEEPEPAPEPAPDVEVVQLCDLVDDADPLPFLRHLVYTAGSVLPVVADTALDGVTPYAPAGTVGTCPADPCPEHVLQECRWDDTDGDGIGDTQYVELLTVEGCTGALTVLGTYALDMTGPYTPVAPVPEGPVEGAPAARGVQAHRVELAAGGTWSAASVQLLQSVTAVAHDGTGTVTTADGVSTLYSGESVTWSLIRDSDAALVGPLTIAAGTGTVTVAYTRGVAL